MFTATQTAKQAPAVIPIIPIEKEKPPVKEVKMEINWTDPKSKVSKYFTVRECLYLPSWNCYHIPTDEEKAEILKFTAQMDVVREFLGKPINVHCLLRPGKVNCPTFDPKSIVLDPEDKRYEIKKNALAALDYNTFIGGAKKSAHRLGRAMDFSCGEDCDETRKKLLPKLVEWKMRMEDYPESSWVHLDNMEAQDQYRYFKP
jgi:hypothetical protein